MKLKTSFNPYMFRIVIDAFLKGFSILILACILVVGPQSAQASEPEWEYKVVILQGVTAGGTIEKEPSGAYVNIKVTRILNVLAADGWEVVAVMGSVATDHTVYLRRRPKK